MSTKTLDIDRFVAFVYETETAITLLDEGIERLAAWDGGEDRRFVAMQLLAQGFERFLKVTKAVIQLNTEGALPTSKQFRTEYGHGLSKLMESNAVEFQRKWYPALAAKQTETLQRAARAVARMWTLGPASENGRRLTGIIKRFLFLTDDKLSTPYNCHPAQ